MSCVFGCAASTAPAQPSVAPPVAATPAEPPVAEPPAAEPPPVEPPPAAAPSEAAAPVQAAPPPAIVVEGYTAELAAALADPWWRGGGTRIAVARRGAVRLRADGPDLGLRDQAPLAKGARFKVVEDAERPRVVATERSLRLLLYVERQDARPVIVRAAPLRPQPGATFADPPQRGHAVLRPGAWVDVVARDGAMVQVVYDEPKARLSGWVDAEALGTTATIVRGVADERPVYAVRRATRLLVRPGGEALTELRAGEMVTARTERAKGRARLVEYEPPCQDDFFYVGFVPAGDLQEPEHGIGYGCGFGSGSPGERSFGEFDLMPRVTIAAGRFLLDPDRPQVVGCALAPTEAVALDDGRHVVATSWGPVPVRLAPEGFAGKCGK